MSTKLNDLFDIVYEVNNLVEMARIELVRYVEDDILSCIPAEQEWKLKKPCVLCTWNRGYDFTVNGFKKRASDNTVMMYGHYHGHADEEFLSYIHGYDSIKKLANAIKDTLC